MATDRYLDTIKLLVKSSANVNARVANPSMIDPGISGKTALGIAKANGHLNVVEFLASVGGTE